jgi:hypothetical protein
MRPLRTSLFARPALMVACAREPPPPVRAPAPQVAPTPFAINVAPPGLDGRWSGRAHLAAGQGQECRRRSMPAAITGNGGRAALTFHRGDTLEGSITSDASMAANGTFQGRRMSGEASRQGCIYNLSLTKR